MKGVSISAVLKDALKRTFNIKSKDVETSLITSFKYPPYGPGQLWEKAAAEFKERGGMIIYNAPVKSVYVKDSRITTIKYGKGLMMSCDELISSLPLADLSNMMEFDGKDEMPDDIYHAASTLPYRDFVTAGLLVSERAVQKEGDRPLSDNWIYVHDKNVQMGRLQIFNNWSPFMVKDGDRIFMGTEYFCNETDELWRMKDKDFAEMAFNELKTIGIVTGSALPLIDYRVEHVKKAYPAYFDSYDQIDKIRDYLLSFSNLWCVGRNGQHRYNNMDQSMLTAMFTADAIISGNRDKEKPWNVNTETEYHEGK